MFKRFFTLFFVPAFKWSQILRRLWAMATRLNSPLTFCNPLNRLGILDLFSKPKLSQSNFLVYLKVKSTRRDKKRSVRCLHNFWGDEKKSQNGYRISERDNLQMAWAIIAASIRDLRYQFREIVSTKSTLFSIQYVVSPPNWHKAIFKIFQFHHPQFFQNYSNC